MSKLQYTLHADQRVLKLSELEQLASVSPEEAMNRLDATHITMFLASVRRLTTDPPNTRITHFCATGVKEEFAKAVLVKKDCIQQPPGYTCHGYLRDLTRDKLHLFYNKIKLPDGSRSAKDSSWIMSLFSADSPFVEVTKSVTFLISDDETTLLGFIFRDFSALDIHVVTNLLIWTRTITEFDKGSTLDILEGLGFTQRQAMALAPTCHIYKNGKTALNVNLEWSNGDNPIYFYLYGGDYRLEKTHMDTRGTYWPCDFVNSLAKGKGLLVSDRSASFNPCNYVLSRRPRGKYTHSGMFLRCANETEPNPYAPVHRWSTKVEVEDFIQKFTNHFTKEEQILV